MRLSSESTIEMLGRRCLVLGATFALFSCERAPRPMPATDCAETTAEFRQWATALAADGLGDVLVPRKGIRLVAVDSNTTVGRLDHSPMLVVTADEVSYSGERMADPRSWPTDGPGRDTQVLPANARPERVQLLIDADVQWTVVRAVVGMLASSGAREIVFAFERDSAARRPGPSTIDADLTRFRQAPLQQADVGRLREKVYGACPAAGAVVAGATTLDPAANERALTVELPRAIEACRCQVDFAAVRAFHWYLAGRLDRRVAVGFTVRLEPDGTLVAIPPETAWREAHRKVIAAAHGEALRF